jgi:hypothetical protein
MTNEDLVNMFGCQDWHAKPNRFKNKIGRRYRKELKQSENFDFYFDAEGNVYILGMLSDKGDYILLKEYKIRQTVC